MVLLLVPEANIRLVFPGFHPSSTRPVGNIGVTILIDIDLLAIVSHSELKLEKETILLRFQELKSEMSKSRGRERTQLVTLTVEVFFFEGRTRGVKALPDFAP